MHRLLVSLLLFVCAVALAAPAALAQDVLQVAGDHARLILETDRVRILEVKNPPGVKIPMHSHPDALAIVLEPGSQKYTMAGGQATQLPLGTMRGTVEYRTAASHSPENAGDITGRALLIEFKQPAPTLGSERKASLPVPFAQVSDNPHAGAFEITIAPGEKVPQHTHGNHITIPLTSGIVQVTSKDGKRYTREFKQDTPVFEGPTTHAAVNIGKTPLRLIVVELK